MNTGLYRVWWSRLGAPGSQFVDRPERAAADRSGYYRLGLIGLAVVLIAGSAGWMALSDDGADSEPVQLATGAEPETTSSPAMIASQRGAVANPLATPRGVRPANGLKISSQLWRRGGLGSNALVTFTLRNGNDYAVRDIEISCAFSRGDGSHLTDRTRVIHDTIRSRGRKTFARLHIGFVNVNADQAKCVPVAASHV